MKCADNKESMLILDKLISDLFSYKPSRSGSLSAADEGASLANDKGMVIEGRVIQTVGRISAIETGNGTLRAESYVDLKLGAKVKLEIIEPGNPAKVKLLAQEVSQLNSRQRAALSFLSMRASLSRFKESVGQLIGQAENPLSNGKESTEFNTTVSKAAEAFRFLAQDSTPAPERVRSWIAFKELASDSKDVQVKVGEKDTGSDVKEAVRDVMSHLQGASFTEQKVTQEIRLPFFLIPFWFKDGESAGHLSMWKEEKQETELKQERLCLFFDLSMQKLGETRLQIVVNGKDLYLMISASDKSLIILRDNFKELVSKLNQAGFRVIGSDFVATKEASINLPVPLANTLDDGFSGNIHIIT